jgi:glycosyltransferase involved in cell wall biosynthesis
MGVEVVYGNIDFMQFAKHFAHYYDCVIMSRPEICAKYVNVCRSLFVRSKIIYDTVDLHYLRLSRQAEIDTTDAGRLKEQSKWYEILEKGLMERSDTTLVVSQKEVEILRSEGVQADIQVVSNIHTINEDAYHNSFSQRKDIVFVGNYAHLPNGDAIKWFVQDIFPTIRNKLNDVTLHIVGANISKSLEKTLHGENIIIHGFVDDKKLENILQSSRVFVAPLRYGAGVKGKIGQAIEQGLPIVTTTIGAEGMFLINNESCIQADDTQAFGRGVIKLYQDEVLWNKVRKNAKNVLDSHFSTKLAVKKFKTILEEKH